MAKVISPPASPVGGGARQEFRTELSEEDLAFVQSLPSVHVDSVLLRAFGQEAQEAIEKRDWAGLEVLFGMLAVTNVTQHARLITSTTHLAALARELVAADTSSALLKRVCAMVTLQIDHGM